MKRLPEKKLPPASTLILSLIVLLFCSATLSGCQKPASEEKFVKVTKDGGQTTVNVHSDSTNSSVRVEMNTSSGD
jgi:hypothetical protein